MSSSSSQNPDRVEPGPASDVRVTLDLPQEAVEELKKLLESADVDAATEEIGELGVSSLQVLGGPVRT